MTSKIEALSGLGKNQEALALASEAMQRASEYHLAGHLFELYRTRGGVYETMGRWDQAVSDYGCSVGYAKQLSYWRGLTQVDGTLAKAYLHEGALQPALASINEAIEANEHIPDELYLAPRNLAIKAEILARLGKVKASNDLYERSADLIDALLSKVPTPTIERLLLSELSEVYSGYFVSLGNQRRDADAFRVIERARGRVEAQALVRHEFVAPREPNPAEQRLTNLNLELLSTDNPSARGHVLDAIYEVKQQSSMSAPAAKTAPIPVELSQLQSDLRPSELFVEYVLDEPQSYALAVTRETVRRYELPSKDVLEQKATEYRSEITHRKTNLALAQQLFDGLLGGIPEYKEKQSIVVVPDGKLHLLPFSALANDGRYILTTHTAICVVDELAHTNVPGSTRAKRWEDVQVLLDAGFDVMTNMNIQHLESLNDHMFRITGIRVRETVPDWFIKSASEVIMVDATTGALLNRLRETLIKFSLSSSIRVTLFSR
jgi:tetratricopeptide (TPR) repeat protein